MPVPGGGLKVGPSLDWLQRMFAPAPEPIPMPQTSVPPVSPLRPEIPVFGDRDLAREVYTYNKLFPEVAQNVTKVALGPTAGSMDTMLEGGFPVDAFQGTNLGGVYSLQDKSIGINPGYTQNIPGRSHILGHEMGHASGILNENLADVTGDLWRKYYSANPYGSKGPSPGVLETLLKRR